MIEITLNQVDTALWLEYQKYQSNIKAILDSGVFNIRNGKAILHLDSNGIIKDIEADYHIYKKP